MPVGLVLLKQPKVDKIFKIVFPIAKFKSVLIQFPSKNSFSLHRNLGLFDVLFVLLS